MLHIDLSYDTEVFNLPMEPVLRGIKGHVITILTLLLVVSPLAFQNSIDKYHRGLARCVDGVTALSTELI